MEAHRQAHAAFHLTGRIAEAHLAGIDDLGLVPALLAGRRDLTGLRYDYPLVLVERPVAGGYVEPLAGIIDRLLAAAVGSPDEGRLRAHALRLEAGVRALVATGAQPRLTEAWDTVAKELATTDESMVDSLAWAKARLGVDGMLLDCDARTPAQVLTHAWAVITEGRAVEFHDTVAHLVLRLSQILEADFQNSPEARSPQHLQESFGAGPMDQFDFEQMSRLLVRDEPGVAMPPSRRHRVQELLSVLRTQRFFPDQSAPAQSPHRFVFDSCAEAVQAFRERLPEAVAVAKAIAVGRLEVDGEYREATHDPLFESIGLTGLDPGDLALFPDYLVLLDSGDLDAAEYGLVAEVLSSGLPFKVLVQTDDVVEISTVGHGHSVLSMANRRLTSMAQGLTDVFVLQAPSSHLLTVRVQVVRGLEYTGPALFSVFSGAGGTEPGIAPYFVAAAALEARVFPVFVYDPAAGPDWAARFSLDGNPQLERDWPVHEVTYQDAACQAARLEVPFTLADFVACDPRYSPHFADVPQEAWGDGLVRVDEVGMRAARSAVEQVPHVLLLDAADTLHRVILDERVVRETLRCREMWRSLQELGGIHNSHAERLLAREEEAWRLQLDATSATASASASPAAAPVGPAPASAVILVQDEAEPEPERSKDEAYIDTVRCSTCNECTQLNNAMFAYNENQQAYIADLKAGTYSQLVEAAESCQVSVIHPGKPWDLSEPGLDDLVARAQPFL